MSRSRHTEAQIIAALRQVEAGSATEDVAREHGVSKHTLYAWKAKYGGMQASEAEEVKHLRDDNARLKKLMAERPRQVFYSNNGNRGTRRPTLRSIARALDIHITTVSKALRGDPNIAAATREKVVRQAAKIGYVPDPMLSALAAYRTTLRPPKFHAVLAWIHPHTAEQQRALLRISSYPDYLVGAEARASQLGYRIEQFWLGDCPSDRLARILHARGIEGVVIAPSAHERCELRNFPLMRFSAVSIGFTLRWPRLNMVTNDHFRTFVDVFHRLDDAGYRRIGCYLDARDNHRMEDRGSSAWSAFSLGRGLPLRIYERSDKESFLKWFNANHLDAVIVGDRRTLTWLRNVGAEIPQKVGVAHYSLQFGEKILAGMYHNCQRTGEAAIDLLASMVQRGERGAPAHPFRMMVDSVWFTNQTVLEP